MDSMTDSVSVSSVGGKRRRRRSSPGACGESSDRARRRFFCSLERLASRLQQDDEDGHDDDHSETAARADDASRESARAVGEEEGNAANGLPLLGQAPASAPFFSPQPAVVAVAISASAAAAAASTSVSSVGGLAAVSVPSSSPSPGPGPAGVPPLPRALTASAREQRAAPDATDAPIFAANSTSRSVPCSPHKSRVSPAASEPPSTGAAAALRPLFTGLKILFVCGPELSSKRAQLLTVQVAKRGGRVVTLDRCVPGSGSGVGSGRGSGAGTGSSGSSGGSSKPPRPTHILSGGVGDSDGRVREAAAALSARTRDGAIFASVEWLSACLHRQTLLDVEPYRFYLHDHNGHNGFHGAARPPMSRAESIAAGDASFSPSPPPPPPPPPAPLHKRDIRYVMETMEQQRAQEAAAPSSSSSHPAAQVKSEPPARPFSLCPDQQQQSHWGAALRGPYTHPPPLSPLAEGAPGQEMGSPAIKVKKEEGEEKRVKLEPGLNSSAPVNGSGRKVAKRLRLDSDGPGPAVRPAASISNSSGGATLSLLASSYSQPVPSFASSVPYDAQRYQPRKPQGGSYLDQAGDGANTQLGAPMKGIERAGWNGRTSEAHSASAASASASIPTSASALYHPHPRASTAGAWLDRNKAQLACQVFSSQHKNHNAHLTSPLEQLESMNSALGDTWRTYAYRKAVGILKKLPERISTRADLDALRARGIRGLGAKIMAKLEEILDTGALAKVESMKSNDMIATMELFTKIHGVGASTARQWYTWGLRTLAQLQSDPRIELSASQRVGLQFIRDKAVRIPRLEVTAILEYVQRAARRILPGVTVICCGSYRRGAPSSGDVDLLFTHESFTVREVAGGSGDRDDAESVRQREGFLRKLLAVLHEPLDPASKRFGEEKAWAVEKYGQIKEESVRIKKEMAAATGAADQTPSPSAPSDASIAAAASAAAASPSVPAGAASPATSFITGDLSSFSRLSSRHGSAHWMGFCSLPSFHPFHSGWNRRLDLKVYPAAHFPFALLYFTGSDHFNRSMRFYAKRKMWTLSDRGLAPAVRVNGDKVWSGRSVYCATEAAIFDALGLLYVPPEQRNVYQHFDLTEEELRIIKHQSRGAATATGTEAAGAEGEEEGGAHPALREAHATSSSSSSGAPAAAAAAAAAAASSSSGGQQSPHSLSSTRPLKLEVQAELSELDQVLRAQEQMRQIEAEEEEILHRQVAALERPAKKV